MTYETRVDNKPGRLSVLENQLEYATHDASLQATFSARVIGDAQYSILVNGNSYSAIVLPDGEVSVNGRIYQVDVIDPRSYLGQKRDAEANGRQTVKAPMPGRVIRLLVTKGQTVEAGQGLIVVEAMKMQNEMKSPKSGVVAEVRTKAGATVTSGDALLVIE